jgi:LmbE family N-acetylglucosaminyl deacetylase
MSTDSALAIAAHPDDIEFLMAGTLLRLRQRGWKIHCLNLASGNLGSTRHPAGRLRRMRREEARKAARILGAKHHGSLADDLEILYSVPLLRRVAAVVRLVRPRIVLTHSPQDYMEDHTNACRLAVTAAFCRGMPNFATVPRRAPFQGEVTVYHAMPHGLRDGLGRRIRPGMFVDTTSVQEVKRRALAAHSSQQEWLEVSQGMNSYLQSMEEMSREVGRMSRVFRHAEGWRRHSPVGFCDADADPLAEALGPICRIDRTYSLALEEGGRP